MLSPDSQAHRARRQAETPLSVLCRIPEPALAKFQVVTVLSRQGYEDLPRLYDNYFTAIGRPVAVSYDRDIDRVVCRFTYRMNVRQTIDWMRETRQDANMIAGLEAALPFQKDLASVFSVQPDGRGGITIEVRAKQ